MFIICSRSHAAVSYCHLDLVQMLLAAGADPNLRDTDGDCPLHVCESSEVASLLLASGAVLQNRNSCGETVLDKALQEANQEMISFYESIGFTDHSFVPPDDNDGEDYERYDVDSAEVQDYLRSLQEGNSEEDAGPASGVP